MRPVAAMLLGFLGLVAAGTGVAAIVAPETAKYVAAIGFALFFGVALALGPEARRAARQLIGREG